MQGAAGAVLESQAERGLPLDIVLRQYVRAHDLWGASRDSLSDLVFGVARRQARLDWRLRDVGVDCTPSNRVAALLYLSGTIGAGKSGSPKGMASKRAAARDADDAGNLAASLLSCNGWLRGLGAPGSELETEQMPLQARLECPDWAWPRFQQAYGGCAEAHEEGGSDPALSAELRALQEPAPLDLRVNLLKQPSRAAALEALKQAGLEAREATWSPVGIRLLGRRVPLSQIPGLLEGAVEPMDEGSQLIAQLVGARPGEVVVDYCAGSGGKTLALSAWMGNTGQVWAMDLDPRRLERGRPRASKAGAMNVRRHAIEPMGKDKFLKRKLRRACDRVLVDAPCSGTGAWRRKPDSRWPSRSSAEVAALDDAEPWRGKAADVDVDVVGRLVYVQAEVLSRAARLVKPGGRLVYATCSILPEENERQVERFLAGAEGEALGWRLETGEVAGFSGPRDRDGYMRLSPARTDTDGFFAAILTRDPI
mmetsp:Transcript_9917/g.22775  ORF Transcript_9917/g.22775 Transcript_9917/m.22775 type:complete len:481 (-) Transcript_9917:260-1702(-)